MTKQARKRVPKARNRSTGQLVENAGLVDWLLSCPEKDWFVPLRSESTRRMSIRKQPHT